MDSLTAGGVPLSLADCLVAGVVRGLNEGNIRVEYRVGDASAASPPRLGAVQ
jgi:hypothetical protein